MHADGQEGTRSPFTKLAHHIFTLHQGEEENVPSWCLDLTELLSLWWLSMRPATDTETVSTPLNLQRLTWMPAYLPYMRSQHPHPGDSSSGR